jgi:hypothetical protein
MTQKHLGTRRPSLLFHQWLRSPTQMNKDSRPLLLDLPRLLLRLKTIPSAHLAAGVHEEQFV